MGRILELIAFALALACLAATGARAASLQDILYGSTKVSGKVLGAAAKEDYNDYGVETKELCLQETNERSCGGSFHCRFCPFDSYFWTSDFQCCREEEYDYGYKRPHNSQLPIPVGGIGGGNAIGSCDWTAWFTNEIPGPEVTSNIYKYASAMATCFFGPGAEECGGPLCDRLAMTLEGTMYYATTAYSYWGKSRTEGDCGPWEARRQAVKGAVGAKPPIAGNNLDNTTDVKPQTAELTYDHSSLRVKPPVYKGHAVIIMGTISSMAGQRKEKWDEGTFEHTVFFGGETSTTTGIDASALWVRDKAYKLTFYKSPGKY